VVDLATPVAVVMPARWAENHVYNVDDTVGRYSRPRKHGFLRHLREQRMNAGRLLPETARRALH